VHTVWLVRRLVRRPPPGLYAHQEEGINQRQDPKTSCAAESAAFRDRGQVLPPAADNHPWLQHALRRSEALTRPGAENITMIVAAGEYLSTHVPEDGPVGDGGAVHALMRGRQGGPVQCFGCQETGHVVANCPHCAQGASALGATLPYNRPIATHQRSNTSAQDVARETDATRRFQEALAAERRMEASTQKLLLLCERVELVCDRIPAAAAEERTTGALHTLSFPHEEACGHKVMTRQDDIEEMARAMEAARRCEIVADDTQALDADWDKFHNPWEHAWPHQVKRWGVGP